MKKVTRPPYLTRLFLFPLFILFPAGTNHTIALGSDGCVWSWGMGAYGRLGHTKPDNELRPKKIAVTVSLSTEGGMVGTA